MPLPVTSGCGRPCLAAHRPNPAFGWPNMAGHNRRAKNPSVQSQLPLPHSRSTLFPPPLLQMALPYCGFRPARDTLPPYSASTLPSLLQQGTQGVEGEWGRGVSTAVQRSWQYRGVSGKVRASAIGEGGNGVEAAAA